MPNAIRFAVGFMLPVLLFLTYLVAQGGPSDAEAVQAEYCLNWATWHTDRRAGVPVEQRYGWPDQAGRYYQECDQ